MKKTASEEAEDVEANEFAAILLVPTEFLRNDLKAHPGCAMDDKVVKALARKYRVPIALMAQRIMEVQEAGDGSRAPSRNHAPTGRRRDDPKEAGS